MRYIFIPSLATIALSPQITNVRNDRINLTLNCQLHLYKRNIFSRNFLLLLFYRQPSVIRYKVIRYKVVEIANALINLRKS